MHVVTFSFVVFREAKKDVNINGCIIPKGWKALTWFREVHFDPEIYPEPRKFDPSRRDNLTPKEPSFPLELEAGCALEMIWPSWKFPFSCTIFSSTTSLRRPTLNAQ